MLSFKEFVTERLGGSESAPGARLSEQLAVPTARMNAGSVDKRLPALMTFARKEIRMFSDGRVVGLYRDLRAGVEMVFPMKFGE